ncbi:hypothetical protein SORBI_3002G018500 [Sorghum bicolor]|uniref:Uncharacterized protein n=1 Tax=Sorghum bicolor TaxID=4558 RepID=A0A1B6Q8Q6_SORBI|nr:hypothetical protein SORBI_3002G018500 [Sorghum bicolor]
MGPKYFVLSACCLLALALALGSQRQVVFARDVPTHTSTGVHGRGVDAVGGLPGATDQSDVFRIPKIPPGCRIPPFCRRAPATTIATNP